MGSALPSNTTSLLNKRAAAYLKLGDYTKAAADGISSFKQAPNAKDVSCAVCCVIEIAFIESLTKQILSKSIDIK